MLKYLRGEYMAGGTAIQAVDEDGFPFADCSVCLAEYGFVPEEDEIVIPAYHFIPSDLQIIMNDLAKEVIGTVHFGYAQGVHIKLRDDWKEFCEEM